MTITLHIRFPDRHVARLRLLADADDRKVAELVRRAVREYLDRTDANERDAFVCVRDVLDPDTIARA